MPDPLDLLVLGAGMVGVSTALHARLKGLSVALIDRRDPGEETSYGNSGVIDGGNLFPLAMPRSPLVLARHALNQEVATHYHPSAMPKLASFLFDYWRSSSPERLEEAARIMRPFFAEAVPAHRELASLAGAERYIRQTGWLELYRSEESLRAQDRRLELSRDYGLDNVRLSMAETLELEPHLKPPFAGAIWCRDADTVSNPGALTKAYAEAFRARGGRVLRGDAASLNVGEGSFTVDTAEGRITAKQVVIALGPWSAEIAERFGCTVPLAVKRGYHRHYRARGNAVLSRQVCDEDVGYVLCPMEQGTRLTTGAEFAERDAPPTPVQVSRAEKAAVAMFDLGEPVEAEPWMGRRPVTPDSRPVIGEAPRQKGLWFAFGHGHWGFTLGPATGKALASVLVGEQPMVDLGAYRPDRW